MVSTHVKELCDDIFNNEFLLLYPNSIEEDYGLLKRFVSKDQDITDSDYLGLFFGLERAYNYPEICKNSKERYYFAYGYSVYLKKVKDGSLDSDDSELHKLTGEERNYASYGFCDSRQELQKCMIADGLLKETKNEKIKR